MQGAFFLRQGALSRSVRAALLCLLAAANLQAHSDTLVQPELPSALIAQPGWTTRSYAVAAANPLATRAGQQILKAGGSEFQYIPVANDTQAFVGALTEIAREHLVGWVDESWDRDAAKREGELSTQRAKAIGAKC